MKKTLKLLLALIALTGVCALPARATVIVDATEVGGNVVFAGGGTFNLAGLVFLGGGAGLPVIDPANSVVVVGGGPVAANDYAGILPPGAFGMGGLTYADLAFGDLFGIAPNDSLFVPSGYISGALLDGSATFTGANFASLGLDPGTYTWSWGHGATADSFILNIVAPSSVPESGSTAVAMLLGLAAIAFFGRYRHRLLPARH